MLFRSIVTVSMEALRFLDGPLNLVFIRTQGTPGLRMVVFSILLLFVILFRQQGLMGGKEFSWDALVNIRQNTAGFLGKFKKKRAS